MFSLSEGVDGAKIKVETDMIQDLSYLNASEAAKDLETKIEEHELNETPFAEEIKPLLETFSNRLPCDDHLIDKPTATVLGTPSLFFAPAIVLRKRNLRSLSASFQKIIDFLETREDINLPILNDLIATSSDSQGIPSQNSNKPFPIEEIFFPKAYNAEQLQILGRLNVNDKVLVQGPPGTGKSHTIANLISHLLAHGNKILVTAYSKRALSVLKDKLPEEVQPLCVSLLGNDRGSINDLEASVKGITARINNPDSIPDQQKIAQLEKNLYEAKKTKAELENDLILLREKDTRKLHLTAVYNGSLLEIAKKINADKQQYGWFIDRVHSLENIDALLTDVSTLIQEHKHFSVLPESEFFCEFPDKTKLISVEDLHNLGEYKKAFEMLTVQNRSNALPELANSLKNLSVQDIHNLKDLLAELQHIQKQLQLCKMPWAEKAITECQSGHDTTWNHIYEETGKILNTQLKQRADAFDREHKIEYPEELSKQKLKADAKVLLAYTKKGGSLKGWKLFKNTEVKERWYFTEKIFVDGSACDTYEELELLIEFLEMELDFEQLSNLWSFHVGQNNSFNTYALQLTGFEKRQKELAHILAILNKKQATENAILNLTRWNKALLDQELETCLVSTEYATLTKNIDVAEYIQKSSIKLLTGGNLHSIVETIRNSIETGDVARYQESLAILNKKEKEYTSYWQYKERTKKIAGILPELTKKILDDKTAFDLTAAQIKSAIEWRYAKNNLDTLLSNDYEKEIASKLQVIENNIATLIETLAAAKAWRNTIDKMGREERSHLIAWYQAVKKIGKGTGKNAWRYRREAQQHMEYSRKTIPAWIMPLYQVSETISPSAAAFDVVIVDEASQLGPEAILLLFLAKKIIIVGDDKQTSPENVGIETEKVNAAIEKHLNDIPFNTFFGLDFSFFDHAFRFCNANNNGMIVLKEHFRCMPEIIEFSNTYFYKPFRSPLYPLRQYSENRLEPLKSTHVKSGFIKGTSPNIINEPEAEEIVSAIEQCIQDAKYNEKTMGIISLQGNNQAELIEHLLVERIGPEEMENRKIVCGTSASFQGDERDIIFLSMVVARDYNFMSLTKAADERRFNVAASRARDQMLLFHSVGLDDLRSDQDLRYKLLEHFYKREESYNYYFDAAAIAIIDRATERPPSPFDSWFEVDICQKIIDKGYKVIPQYKIAYYKVDLAVILPNGAKIAVECDGDKFHGVDEYQQDILRQRTLERVGLQF